MPFSLDGEGCVLASWMSRNRVYWALSNPGGTRFGPRIPAPFESSGQNHPLALANARGQVLLVWTQGKLVQWASYDRSGRFTGARGSAAASVEADRPSAYVAGDGSFHILL